MTRPELHIVKAKLHEISVRYRKPVSMAAIRCAEIDRLVESRYGAALPADDAGRDDVWIMVHHLAQVSGDGHARIVAWLARRAPWMPPSEREALVTNVFAKPVRWRAITLGEKFRLTSVERSQLGIKTIAACDMTKAESDAARENRKRLAKRAQRRRDGVKPRQEYETSAIGHGKPWIAAGVSKATWYRRQPRSAPR
jgi:hypothetical protein